MAPESNTPENAQRTAPSGQTVAVPTPADGAGVTVVSSPGGELELGFDPGAATATRSDNSLVFELDGGGTVTITDFFAVGDESLPNLKLPDGTVVASAEFFEGSDLDMTTAAGPGAGAPGSGGTNYADDPGALLNGLDKYGKLGTDYWGRDTEYGEEFQGLILPTGTFSFGVSTEGQDGEDGFKFILGAYEDGAPRQHVESLNPGEDAHGMLDGRTYAPARVDFYPQPGPATSIGVISFWDLPEGTTLYFADPSSPTGYSEINPGPGGVYTFSEADFVNPGVYLVPPENSDNDFTFSASVELIAPGGSTVVPGTVDVIVDAVADLPMDLATEMGDAQFDGESMGVSERETTQEFDKGWAKDAVETNRDATDAKGAILNVPFDGSVDFFDVDGSEQHYFLVEVPSKDNMVDPDGFLGGNNMGSWRFELSDTAKADGCTVTGQIRLWYNVDGEVIGETPLDGAAPDGAVSSKDFFQIHVPNEAISGGDPGAQEGRYNLKGDLVSDDSNITQDTQFVLESGAKAAEETISGDELDLDNNVSYTFGENSGGNGQTVTVDVVDARLEVAVGWASEGDNDAKHIGGVNGAGYSTFTESGLDKDNTYGASTTEDMGAPIRIAISDTAGEPQGSAREFITQVTLEPDEGRGEIYVGGKSVTDILADGGSIVVGGVTYTVSEAGDVVTIEVGGKSVTDLGDLITFRPADSGEQSYSDADVNLTYTVTVENTAGASAVYDGTTVVAIDAVADRSAEVASVITSEAGGTETGDGTFKQTVNEQSDGKGDARDGWLVQEFKADSTGKYELTVKVTTRFSDLDGSEKHYLLVQDHSGGKNDPQWSVDEDALLKSLQEAYPGLGLTAADIKIVSYTNADGETYFAVDVSAITQANGFAGDGTVSVDVPLKVINVEGDMGTVSIKTGSIAEEQDGRTIEGETGNKLLGKEYDTNNNFAERLDGDALDYEINVINSKLTVKAGWASESKNDAKFKGADAKSGDYEYDGRDHQPDWDPESRDTLGDIDLGAPIVIAIDGATGEYISSVTLTLPKEYTIDAKGVISLDGEVLGTLHPGSGVTLSVVDGVITISGGPGVSDVQLRFVPNQEGFNQEDIPLNYEVVVSDGTATATATGSTSIVIDAVADKAVISGLETQYAADTDTGWEQTAAKPDQDVTLKATVRFPDTTEGNETHTIQIAALENGSGDSAAIKSVTLTGVDGEGNAVTLYFVMVEDKLVQYDSPGGQPVEGAIPISADGNGAYNIVVDETVGTCDVTIKASGDAAEGTNGLKLDTNYEIAVNGISEVNVPDGDAEYDYNNNTAFTPGKVGFEVAPGNSDGFGADAKDTFESTDGNWHGTNGTAVIGGKTEGVHSDAHGMTGNTVIREDGVSTTYGPVNANVSTNGDISFSVDQGGGSAEQIYSVSMTVAGDFTGANSDPQGSFWVQSGNAWVKIDPESADDAFTFERVPDGNDGWNTVITYTTPTKEALSDTVTVKYVGKGLDDTDLAILESEVVLVNSKSYDKSEPIHQDHDDLKVVVDAVANQPTDLAKGSNTSGSESGRAAGGENVELTVSITFPDHQDDSESHSLLLQNQSSAGFSYDSLAVVIGEVTYTPASHPAMFSEITIGGIKYFKINVDGLLGVDGSVSATFTITTPMEYGNVTPGSGGGYTYWPRVGGMSEEHNYNTQNDSQDQDSRIENNVAVNVGTVPVYVDLIDSEITVSVGGTWENGRPNAHIWQTRDDDAAMSDKQGAVGDDVDTTYKFGNRGGLSDDGKVIDSVAELRAVGAAITVNQSFAHNVNDSNETISGAIFQINAGSDPESNPNQFMYKGELISVPSSGSIDGDDYTCELVNNGDGTYSVKITIDGFDPTETLSDDTVVDSLYFIPGNNHDSGELDLDYAITVKDGTTGQEKVFASDGTLRDEALETAREAAGTDGPDPLGKDGAVSEPPVVNVDSVAEAALIETNSKAGVGGSEYVAPGGVAEIGMTITVLDANDGSEQQFVFVEEISDWDVESMTIGGNIYTIAYLEENGLITRQTIDLGDGEPRAYWKITLPEHEITGKGDNLELDVVVKVQTDGNTNTVVHTGTGSQEKFLPGENNDIYDDRPEGDTWEGTFDNNTSFRPGGGVAVNFDPTYYSKPGLDVPKGYYEHGAGKPVGGFNDPVDAYGNTGRCVPIDLNAGTGNSITSITITVTGGDNGTLYFFDDADKRDDFMTDYNNAVKSGGQLPNPLDDAYGGKAANGTVTAGEDEDLNGGGFAFLPDPGSHKDGDFSFDYEMDYTNNNTGTNETAEGSGKLIGDAVAQFADKLGNTGVLDSEGNAVDLEDMRYNSFDEETGEPNHVYKTNLSATFFDIADGSSEHFMLIEAEANWTFRYTDGDTVYSSDGAEDTVAMEVYVDADGTHYYMIPVTPGAGGKASAEVEMIPPKYNMAIDGSGDIQTGALSRETDAKVVNELNWNNNQAITIDKGFEYELNRGPGYGPEVGITGLYEDNRPEAHESLDAAEKPGMLHIDQPAGADSVVITFPGDSEAVAEICYQVDGNWVSIPVNGSYAFDGYTVTNNGNGSYTVTGLNGSGSAAAQIPVRVTEHWSNDDKDFSVDYQYKNGGENVGDKHSFDAVVDAVADLADLKGVADDTNAQGDVNHAAGASKLTSISVEVEFDDVSDDSENRYILVEKSSEWAPVGDYTTVYHEGVAYYCIDVTGVPLVNGKLSHDIPIEYKGNAKDYAEGELGIRIMTQEKNFGDPNGNMEIRTDNNTAVTDEITATVAYSRATSTLTVKVGDGTGKDQVEYGTALVNEDGTPYTGGTPHVVNAEGQIVEAGGADLGWPVNISINYDGNDVLLDISFSNIPKGSFLFVNGNLVDTGKPLSEQLEALGLNRVEDIKDADVTYRPGQFEHHDQTFTWNATFKDTLSNDQATASGDTSVIIDAFANGSDNEREMTDTSGKWTAVKSGERAVIAVDADFIDDESEDLFVVLEQKLGYDLVGIKVYDTSTEPPTLLEFDLGDVVTKYGMDGETYYAIKVDKDVRVEFEIKTQPQTGDTDEPSLKAGTITVVPDADKEYTLGNNWTENIDKVAIKTGVVETEGVSFTMGDLTENDPAGAAITMSGDSKQALSDNNEEVGELTFHFSMPGASGTVTIMYGDQAHEITFDAQGNASWTVPGAFDPNADLSIVWGTFDKGVFKPNHSGTGDMTVHTEGTIVDLGSGDEASFDKGLGDTMTYVPMPDPGTTPEVKSDVDAPSKISGQHKASVDVLFNTEFVDTDGSEAHALVFLVPAGMSVDGATVLNAQEISDMKLPPLGEGQNYYRLPLSDTDTKADHTVTFTVDKTYREGQVISYAVSEEGRNQGEYKVSQASDPITITEPGSLNEAPEAIANASGEGKFGTTLTTPVLANQTIDLTKLFSDNEKDGILLTGVQFGNGTKVEIPATGSITVNGEFGVLTINANGTYSYTLFEGVSVTQGAQENFTLWGKDSYGAAANGTSQLNIKFGSAVITGSSGADSITGTDVAEVIYGMTGNDTIDAGSGDDTIRAGEGNNLIYAGTGTDRVTSGAGNDTIYTGDGNDTVNAGGGANRVFIDGSGNKNITTGSGADYIKIEEGAGGSSTVKSGSGNDTVDIHGGGSNTVNAENGNDQINVYGNGHNVINAGAGDDIVHIYGNGSNRVDMGAGNDTVYVSGSGENTLTFNSGFNLADLNAATGNNVVNGGSQADTIYGGGGHDKFYAGAGDDVIYTGGGNNLVYGGAGSDTMYSGSGENTFAWKTGDISNNATDSIVDFKYGHDLLQFDGGSVDDYIKGIEFTSANKVTLTVGQGSASQSIEVNFTDDDAAMREMYDTYREYQSQNNTEASDAILAHLINTLTNNN